MRKDQEYCIRLHEQYLNDTTIKRLVEKKMNILMKAIPARIIISKIDKSTVVEYSSDTQIKLDEIDRQLTHYQKQAYSELFSRSSSPSVAEIKPLTEKEMENMHQWHDATVQLLRDGILIEVKTEGIDWPVTIPAGTLPPLK